MTTMGTAAEEKQQRLVIDVPRQLPLVLADRTALRRVVCGVLDNAIKYTPDGGRITISTRHAANELGIAISDSGPGIDADDLPRVFDKFYRGRPQLPPESTPQLAERVDVPGIGLGLYLARTMIDQLGGRLEVETERGRGSTFTIWLPIATGVDQQGEGPRQE
jgi:signal transduction histidine kinase